MFIVERLTGKFMIISKGDSEFVWLAWDSVMFYTEKKLLNIFYIKNLFCGYFPEVTIFTILQVFKEIILIFGDSNMGNS